MSNKFLFELGTEEIPASMISPALEQLAGSFRKLLNEAGVVPGDFRLFNSPRRLAVEISDLPDRCPDREELVTGPPVSAAFDRDGKPGPAAHGFARKSGVPVEALERIETEKGWYLALRRTLPGDRVVDRLARSIPDIVAAISWPKTMYWTESRFRFIRPLRWFVGLWNSEVVPFEIEGLKSGRTSRGHRLIGSAEVVIDRADDYCEALRKARVLVDPVERRARIEAGLREAAMGFRLRPDEELLATVSRLVEYPSVLRGDFKVRFLEIPEEVLVTVMRYHQKYFSLETEDGKLAPHFLTVLNTDGDPYGSIRQGHEKVLQARLEDAEFFWKSDRKAPLQDRLSQLDHVLFQERLGTYLEKTTRVRALCRFLAPSPELDEAAALCKTDLTTDMVRELTELQGIMGGLYAREEGKPELVWRAIYEHYLPVSLDDQVPQTRDGALLSIADRIDTVVGCFGVGIIPSGSSDPFAVRRQAQGLISILLAKRFDWTLSELVEAALANYPSFDAAEVRKQVLAFLEQRLNFILLRQGFNQDVLRAVFAVGVTSAADAEDRAKALSTFKGDEDFEALAIAFKRSKNILAKSGVPETAVVPELFGDPGEQVLFDAVLAIEPALAEEVKARSYSEALRRAAGLRGAVDRFFEDVLVMAEDESVRRNRLALLARVCGLFLSIADPSEIVQQGGQNGS